MVNEVSVIVPATTANLGSGFDCIGLALNLFNRVTFIETSGGLSVEVRGEGSGVIPVDATNLVVRAAERLFEVLGRRPAGFHLIQENNIPVSSGLGSSAAAVLGGLLAANKLLGEPLEREALLPLATEIEGHPDNVTPALYGGLTLTIVDNKRLVIEPVSIPELDVVVVLPQFNLSTADARAVLPQSVPLSDAVYNASRVGLLVRALAAGNYGKLRVAMDDKLHQPYRLQLIPGMAGAFEAALDAGAAVALSGAGPSVIALAPSGHRKIGEAMVAAFSQNGLESRMWILQPVISLPETANFRLQKSSR